MPPPNKPGFCGCGCGKRTRIPTKTERTHGITKGVPLRFIRGHATAKPREESRTIVVEGIICRTIPLTQGKQAIVDSRDYEVLRQWRWSAKLSKRTWYAVRVDLSGGERKFVGMHQQLLGSSAGLTIDHRNHNGLDNRKCNLRHSTVQQNNCNQLKNRNNSSGFTGVCSARGRWRASIRVNRKAIHLGYFATPEVAAKVYDDAALKYFGEFANLNFPTETANA